MSQKYIKSPIINHTKISVPPNNEITWPRNEHTYS